MVAGELLAPGRAGQVDAGVAHVRDAGHARGDVERGSHAAHPVQLGPGVGRRVGVGGNGCLRHARALETDIFEHARGRIAPRD